MEVPHPTAATAAAAAATTDTIVETSYHFDPKSEYLISPQAAFAGVAGYLFVLYALHKYVRDDSLKNKLRVAFGIHNATLSFASAVLLVLLVCELWSMAVLSSVWDVYCDAQGKFVGAPVYFYYYVNYLFKWWELLDTVFLVLRRSRIRFLHVYHHAATLLLCMSQIWTESCMQWVPISLNLFVHVFMYFYYAADAFGYDMKWIKRNITTLQITQFVIDLVACLYPLYLRFTTDIPKFFGYAPWGKPYCYGSYWGAAFGIVLLSTYLVAFIRLFKESYSGKDKKAKAA